MTTSSHKDPAGYERVVIPSDLKAAKRPEHRILHEVKRCRFSNEAIFAIRLALEEAVTNAIKHGNRRDPSKQVLVRFKVCQHQAEILVRDDGPGFHPNAVPDPTRDENIERPNGRGIMLMRAYMDDVSYNDAGNEVRMIKVNR